MTCKLIIRGGDNERMLSASPVLWLTRVNKDALGHIMPDDGDAAGDISRQVQDLKKMLPMYLIDQSPGSFINRVSPDDVKMVHRSVRGSEWWGDLTNKDPLNLPFLAGALVDCISTCRSVCHQPYVLVLRLQASAPRTPPRAKKAKVAVKMPPAEIKMPPAEIKMPPAEIKMPPAEVEMPPAEVEMPPAEVAEVGRPEEFGQMVEEAIMDGGFDAVAAQAFHDERWRQFLQDREQGGRGAMLLSGDKFV
jgi:hypothetical protein